MSTFFIALGAVAILLLQAVPGYVFVKKKVVGENTATAFSKVLMYVCQPCLSVYTFSSATPSPEKFGEIGIFALATLAINGVMLAAGVLVFRKKFLISANRILTLAMAFSNCAFFGIPIIEALLGDAAKELIIYTSVYAAVMNIIGWAVGIAIITGNVKNVSAKKIFVNPAMLGIVIALPLFVFNINGSTYPYLESFFDAVAVVGRMTTPISMIIMGMRLANTSFKSVFTSPKSYIAVAVKGFAMPALAFLLVYFLPIPQEVKCTFFIITACPTASVVLNFSEICGTGQREAASAVLMSTLFSILTLPIMVLMLPLLI